MKNFNIENVMNGNASAEEVKALLAQIIEKNGDVIRKEVAISIEGQMRAEITDNIKELYEEDRIVESDDKKFVLIDTGKKNHYEWDALVEKIREEDVNDYSERAMCSYGDYRNLPTQILKEKIFKNVPFKYFVYSVPALYGNSSISDNEMVRDLVESDLIEDLEVEEIKQIPNEMYVRVAFDLPLLIKNEVTALKSQNYVKWIGLLQDRKNNKARTLSKRSVKDFVLDAVFEQEE